MISSDPIKVYCATHLPQFDLGNIKDYDNVHLSKREGLPASDLPRIPFLKKVHGVFDPDELEFANDKITKRLSLKIFFYPSRENPTATRTYYINNKITPFSFDFRGKVENPPISISKGYKTKQVMIKAMERFASELNWKSTTRYLNFRVISYKFFECSGEPLLWHSDANDHGWVAKHTFIVLLSNPQGQLGWTGGDLLYSFRLNNNPVGPVWKIKYSQNDAILFGNEGMMHKISSMSCNMNSGCRTILSISDYGSERRTS